MMSFFKIVLLGLIYLRATLDLGYILMFRLAHRLALATGVLRGLHPIPDHLWVSVLPSTSQTATWTPGDWV